MRLQLNVESDLEGLVLNHDVLVKSFSELRQVLGSGVNEALGDAEDLARVCTLVLPCPLDVDDALIVESDVDSNVIESTSHVGKVESDVLEARDIWESIHDVIVERVLIADVKVSLKGATVVEVVDVSDLEAGSAGSDGQGQLLRVIEGVELLRHEAVGSEVASEVGFVEVSSVHEHELIN